MIQIPKRWDQWFKSLIAATVSGFCGAVLPLCTAGAANSLGANIEPFHWKQILDIGLTGAFIGAVMYLKQSPVPPDSTGNTNFISPKPTNPNP